MNKFIGVLMTMLFLLCICTARCPPRTVAMNLDLEKFSGEWFVISGMPPEGYGVSNCGHFFINQTSPEKFIMNFTALSSRTKNFFTFDVNATLDDNITGYWKMRGLKRTFGPYKHRVIDVDYNSHFVMIACGGDIGDVPAREFSMIWSRKRTLPSTLLDTLKDKAGSYIDKSLILDVDQSNCSQTLVYDQDQ